MPTDLLWQAVVLVSETTPETCLTYLARMMAPMDPLAGWTVAVTAERRAGEQVALLQSGGVAVLLTPTVRAERVADATLRAATAAVVGRPPDLWVASSAAGVQGWIATAWSWGLGPALLRTMHSAAILARGASTA